MVKRLGLVARVVRTYSSEIVFYMVDLICYRCDRTRNVLL